jgi:hypothetical protein
MNLKTLALPSDHFPRASKMACDITDFANMIEGSGKFKVASFRSNFIVINSAHSLYSSVKTCVDYIRLFLNSLLLWNSVWGMHLQILVISVYIC